MGTALTFRHYPLSPHRKDSAAASRIGRSKANTGVFAGNPSRRVRDSLWETLGTRIGDGQAVLVESADNEQGWAVRTAGRDRWRPVDYDGLILSARAGS